MTFIPLLRIAGALASDGLTALRQAPFMPIKLWPIAIDEVFNKPADELWDEATKAAAARAAQPRVITDRGLGPNERSAFGWIDREGDRWRYNHELNTWEYRLIRPDVDGGWLRVPTEPDGFTSNTYGPYIEILKSSSADGAAANTGSGPAAEGSCPASAPTPSSADAGQPPRVTDLAGAFAQSGLLDVGRLQSIPDSPVLTLSGRELRDAAYAIRGFAQTSPVPEGWHELATKLTSIASQLPEAATAAK